MEQDRYRQNHTLYIVGIVFMVLSMSLFILTLYILPYLLLQWRYDVPEFVSQFKFWLQFKHHYTESFSAWLVFLLFLCSALICAGVAYFASNRIENQIYGIEPEIKADPEKVTVERKRSFYFLLRILSLVVLAIIVVWFFEWMITTTP